MNVGSLLEIYTTMFGWSIYNTMFDLFRASGLLLFPFIMMIIRNWSEPMRSQSDKAASLVSLNRVFYDGLAMIAVFMVAVIPYAGLDLDEVRYKVACTDSTDGSKTTVIDEYGEDTGTTYDTTLGSIATVKMPVLWWLVLSVGEGVNAALTTSFTCFEDIKGLDMQLRNLTIKDQSLRKEYMNFANQCFIPAKSKFTAAMRGEGKYSEYIKTAWGNFLAKDEYTTVDGRYRDDWMFIGSHFYLETDGFWKEYSLTTCQGDAGGCGIKSKKPVYDWDIKQTRDQYSDVELDNKDDPDNKLYGKPYCDEWWTDDTRGLRQKLLDSIEADKEYMSKAPPLLNETFTQRIIRLIKNAFTGMANTYAEFAFEDWELQDIIINNYVAQDPPSFLPSQGGVFGGSNFASVKGDTLGQIAEKMVGGELLAGAMGAGVGRFIVSKGLAGSVAKKSGTTYASELTDFYVNMFIAKQAAPMVQAIILMMIYMLLLIYMLMSDYDIEATIQMIFIILGIKFFTTIWNFADYLDARLFVSMHPNATMLGSMFNMGINRLILDIVLTILYVVAPFLLLWVMNMAGSKVNTLSQGMGGLKSTPSTKGAGKGVEKAI